jgi:hypothetical protein
MALNKLAEQSFDAFRRERKIVKSKLPTKSSVLGYENAALRELEQVEEREVRDQQLTREVHEFFASATRQAAAIVEKVSHDAEEQAGERMQEEVETFLMDTLTRMNGFIMSVMHQRPGQDLAETHVEPDIKHLIGPELDAFRHAGASATREAHIGQDPFATDLEDVQREFRAVVADMEDQERGADSIEDHLVAQAKLGPDPGDDLGAGDEADAPIYESVVTEEAPLTDEDSAADDAPGFVDSVLGDPTEPEEAMSVEEMLETFKSALKALVRQGVMQREEARAAWNARLVALGRKQD